MVVKGWGVVTPWNVMTFARRLYFIKDNAGQGRYSKVAGLAFPFHKRCSFQDVPDGGPSFFYLVLALAATLPEITCHFPLRKNRDVAIDRILYASAAVLRGHSSLN